MSYNQRDSIIVDTIVLNNDSTFALKGDISEPTRLFISIENKYDPRLVGDFTVYRLWIEPNRTMDFHGFKNWRDGWDNYKLENSITDSLAKVHQNLLHDENPQDDADIKKNFIKGHQNSYYALNLLFVSARPSAYCLGNLIG